MKAVKELLVSHLIQFLHHQLARRLPLHLPKNRKRSDDEEFRSLARHKVQIKEMDHTAFKQNKNLYLC
jgi:hypothetical protein